MNKLSDFLVAYKALEELYWSGFNEFCVVNPAFDPKSMDSKQKEMDSHDEKWNQKYSEAIELAGKCGQSEDVEKKKKTMQQWNDRLEACKGGYIGRSYLFDNISANPNAQNSTPNNGKI